GAVFTPGELLKIALAACAGMSSDRTFARRLGDDYAVTIHAEGVKDLPEDRYPEITERFEIDLSSLDDEARERLLTVAERAIEKTCTVGRTIKAGATVRTVVQRPGGSVARRRAREARYGRRDGARAAVRHAGPRDAGPVAAGRRRAAGPPRAARTAGRPRRHDGLDRLPAHAASRRGARQGREHPLARYPPPPRFRSSAPP